ncbi:tripartite tricarboxylate transporter substrate-binding protein [Variovorax sp. VNK109]|uniref:tripartite tricarboxylate transporter substrate-binding protein n=1 Tax=Variovorax sp. VNK109 TaxID=3400919 RepID=UPI003C0E541B
MSHSPLNPPVGRRDALKALGGMAALGSFGSLASLAPLQALAQAVSGTTRVVIGFPPGGTVDVVARRIGDKLAGGYTSGPVIVEGKPGAGGRIACEFVKNAPADGATMLLTPSSIMSVFPVIYKDLRYDPFKDFKPMASAGIVIHSLVVSSLVPASVKNLDDFVAWARANPKDAAYGSPSPGSIPHFVGAALGIHANLDLRHIGYRGAIPGLNDILGGQLPAMVVPIGDAMQYYKAGRLRVLGISSAQRFPLVPDIPTFAEQGYKHMTSGGFYGFFVPARTPDSVIAAGNAAINQALTDPGVAQTMANMGLIARPETPASLAAAMKEENEYWGGIVRRVGFTGES